MILALIPARAGSKGIKNKNICKVGRIPLFQRAINAAKTSKKINKIVVSSDSKKILKKCRRQKIECINRPFHLAKDDTPMGDVVLHAYRLYKPQAMVLLQPTSPFRCGKLIDKCIKIFQSKKYDALATGYYAQTCPFETNNKQRQQLKQLFYDDGNIYIFSKKVILKKTKFGNKNCKVVISKMENIEIDTDQDLKFANEIAKCEAKK